MTGATATPRARAQGEPGPALTNRRFVRRFAELGLADVSLVGGKNASLGEMYRQLTRRGVRVPNGIAITAEAPAFGWSAAGLFR